MGMPNAHHAVGAEGATSAALTQSRPHVILVGCHAADLDQVRDQGWRVSLISRRGSLERLPDDVRRHFAGIEVLDGTDDGSLSFYEDHAADVIRAAERLVERLGPPSAAIGLYEHTVLPAATVRQHFGLAGLSVDAAQLCRDKVRMKQALATHGVRVPLFAEFTSDPKDVEGAEAFFRECPGRVVVKPRRQAAARGLHVVETHDDLRRLAGQEDLQDYEIEQYVDGDIYHVDAVVRDASIAWLSAGRYVGSCADYGAPDAALASVVESDPVLVDHIRTFTRRVVDALDITDTVIHLELFHVGSGELVFLEVACRPAGGPGTPWMYRELFGVDLVHEQVLAATGSPTGIGPAPRPTSEGSPHIGWLMTPAPLPRDGRVMAIHGTDDLPDVVVASTMLALESTIADSDPVWPNSGVFLLRAASPGELDDAMASILRTFWIEVVGAEGRQRSRSVAG